MKQVMTDAINGIVKDENVKLLQVFQKAVLACHQKDWEKQSQRSGNQSGNYLRQDDNRNVDRALLTGACRDGSHGSKAIAD